MEQACRREERVIKARKPILIFTLLASVAAHLVLLNLKSFPVFEKKSAEKPHQFTIDSIRTVGEKDKKSKNLVHIPKQIKTDSPEKSQAPKGKDISLSDLQAQPPSMAPNPTPTTNSGISSPRGPTPSPKPLDALSLNNKTVQNFMQNTPNAGSSGEYAKAFGESNVLVELEVPEGVPEDELNQYELVFYSFRKRTALNYINAFYNELNGFQSSNPHLKFPMTENKESMTGRITYDAEGNIVRIKMLKWTNKEQLQQFFLQVLKNMNSLPNPPEVIIKDGEFHVYYSLTVNG